MDQLTVRGFDPALLNRLKALAEREDLSLSQAAVRLMRRGAGLEPAPIDDKVGGSLDWLFGVDDGAHVDEVLEEARRVDPDLWR